MHGSPKAGRRQHLLNRPTGAQSATLETDSAPVRDVLGRPIRNLRLSLIDKCNLRCGYCMPEESYVWLPREDILRPDEIGRLVGLFADLGVDRVRLTGGEPLLRPDAAEAVEVIAGDPRIRDISMTTNGVLLAGQARALVEAGLNRVTVSLDSLRRERFARLTQRDELDRVLEGIAAAAEVELAPLKINTVVMRGENDDELGDLLEFGSRQGAEVRFIEYMDVGGATRWSMGKVVPRREILERLEERYGPIRPLEENGSAPADRFALADGTTFGVISSTTEPFCRSCDRSRVTADGLWFTCLYSGSGTDLRSPLRGGADDEELRDLIAGVWRRRRDRGAEERKELSQRGPLYQIEDLRSDPHREMHTRGG